MAQNSIAGAERIAIVHPWFITNGGGEKVIEAMAEAFPAADFFALIVDAEQLPPALRGRSVTSSFLTHIPKAGRFYQHLMPLYPLAATQFDLRGYDVVLSSGGPGTKGVITRQDACHIHYCHSPVRFLWDQFPAWLERLPRAARPLFAWAAHGVREWDFNSAQRVDLFLANSAFIAQRIHTYYRRSSTVLYPPVEASRAPLATEISDAYLCVARLVPGKRIELLVEACNRLQRRLVLIGAGPERQRLSSLAGPTVQLLGRVDDQLLQQSYARARAFLFSAEEDFGIAPVEAQSYGLPVIAYGGGGVGETVIDARQHPRATPTGILYAEQTVDAVCAAILRYEQEEQSFDRAAIRRHAQGFDRSVFVAKIRAMVEGAVAQHRAVAAARLAPAAGVSLTSTSPPPSEF